MKLSLLILLFVFISCGKDGIIPMAKPKIIYKVEPAKGEEYSYEFRKSKCTTGEHKFTTLVAACDGLRDESLNNECAPEKREVLFTNSECSGDFS